jgi:hypothetical protein
MSALYEIVSGSLYDATGVLIGVGYSGSPEHKNDPEAQSLHNQGPIPAGRYHIGPPQDTVTHGPFVLPLTPDPANEMFGRYGFLIHGDSVVHPGTASQGCIIQSRDTRVKLWTSGDRDLIVVATKG